MKVDQKEAVARQLGRHVFVCYEGRFTVKSYADELEATAAIAGLGDTKESALKADGYIVSAVAGSER